MQQIQQAHGICPATHRHKNIVGSIGQQIFQMLIEFILHQLYFTNSPKVYENDKLNISWNCTLGARWPSLSAIMMLSS